MLYFHQIYSHAMQLNAGQATYNCFNDQDSNGGKRITFLTESQIIYWIFEHISRKDHFLSTIMQDTNINNRLFVEKPVIQYGDKPGDIDILMWPKNRTSE